VTLVPTPGRGHGVAPISADRYSPDDAFRVEEMLDELDAADPKCVTNTESRRS
jgi:hypothetical protein